MDLRLFPGVRFFAADPDAPRESRPPGSEGSWVRGAIAVAIFLLTVWLYALARG